MWEQLQNDNRTHPGMAPDQIWMFQGDCRELMNILMKIPILITEILQTVLDYKI